MLNISLVFWFKEQCGTTKSLLAKSVSISTYSPLNSLAISLGPDGAIDDLEINYEYKIL